MPSESVPPSESRTEVLPGDSDGIGRAAQYLRAGHLVGLPTETVYGLAADATNPAAVRAVFEAKGRPHTDPLIVHVQDLDSAEALGDVSAGGGAARTLAEAFWPGPLTIVVPRSSPGPRGGKWSLAAEVSMGPTVGLRCPANQVALDVIAAAGVPLAAPSANRFGRVSPTCAQHVLDELDGRIRAVVDAGPTTLGVESTVVGFHEGLTCVLRPGGVTVEDLIAILGNDALDVTDPVGVAPGDVAESPGTSVSHYAPDVPVILTEATEGLSAAVADELTSRGLRARLLELPEATEAARDLYSMLRALDRASDREPPDCAVVAALDPAGLGRAVNDRLFRAASGHIYSNAEQATVEAMVSRIHRMHVRRVR